MARKHPGMYRVRASRHTKAAKNSTGYKKAGHEEIASGYRKLAAHAGGATHAGRRRKKSHKRGRKKATYGSYFGRTVRHRG